MKNCLVTGATGFLGANLVHELAGAGWHVRAFGLPGSNIDYIKDLSIDIVSGDITVADDISAAVEGCEVVFHVAGDTSWWKKRFAGQRAVNVDGTVNVAEACLRHDVKRLVHTSTIDILGYNPDGLADETWRPYNYGGTGYNYADTKREGELRLREYMDRGLEAVIIYPGSMIGPYDFTLQYGRLFFDLRDGKVPGCPAGGVSFGHVTEVARAQMAAAVKGRAGEGYVCAGLNLTYRALFGAIAAYFGKKAPRLTIPRKALVAYGYLMQTVSYLTNRPPEIDPGMARYMSVNAFFDSAKAVRELDYVVPPLQKMLDDAYDWYCDNGFLSPS